MVTLNDLNLRFVLLTLADLFCIGIEGCEGMRWNGTASMAHAMQTFQNSTLKKWKFHV